MTTEEAVQAALGAVISALGAAVWWLIRAVIGNRDSVRELELRVQQVERQHLSRDDVRQVVEDVLSRWERAMTAELRQVLADTVSAALVHEREDVERMVRLVVRETCAECRNRED